MAKKHPPLPPEPAAGDGTQEGEALAAIKAIHEAATRPASSDDEARFEARSKVPRIPSGTFSPWCISTRKSICTERRGRLVWRIHGRVGADFDRYPLSVEIIRAEQAFQTQHNIVARLLRLPATGRKGVKTRQEKAARLMEAVLLLSKTLQPKQIAHKLGISPRRVNQIISENKKRK